MLVLALAFLVTAILYASVGFGGGSTYNALLALSGADYRVLPVVALICNLIVVSGSTPRYLRRRLVRPELVLPFVVASVPMAWLGGRLPVSRSTFMLTLGLALLASGIAMLLERDDGRPRRRLSPRGLWALGLPAGAGLGLLAGIVGIGGGIFLAPLLHLLRLAGSRVIAATACVFILVNSLSGLAGQLAKGTVAAPAALLPWWPLFPAVLAGGQLGNWLGVTVLSLQTVTRLTAILVVYVGLRLLYAWWLLPPMP